jgi:hypothetical protein
LLSPFCASARAIAATIINQFKRTIAVREPTEAVVEIKLLLGRLKIIIKISCWHG